MMNEMDEELDKVDFNEENMINEISLLKLIESSPKLQGDIKCLRIKGRVKLGTPEDLSVWYNLGNFLSICSHLQRIELPRMAINDSQMQIIANSLISRQPGAIGVQYLDLSYNRIHYEGIKALVENMTRISKSDDISGANSLHKLLLAGNPIDCRACG
ncbi:MAG: hypothetical protein MHMPM18_005085 [Marteilia pararefringens]